MRLIFVAALALTWVLPANAAQVDDAKAIALAKPAELVVSNDIPQAERDVILKPVDAFYGFWNNGSETLLRQALAPDFKDQTLPPGRPQGPEGPMAASKTFLKAVPDLTATVVQRIVVADRVVSHIRFSGHFTGTFQDLSGKGQPIDFIATDILRVQNGKITDNWHIEDNLTLLQQMGLAKVGG